MSTSYTALWSAVAASFSALSAFLLMLIHRRNLMESVRPDLIPLDWSRSEEGEGESKHEVIRFKRIRNVGRGAAFNVVISGKEMFNRDDLPTVLVDPATVVVVGCRFPVIAPNESIDTDGNIAVWWKNIEQKGVLKHCYINVFLCYTDARDIRYLTEYSAFAVPLGAIVVMTEDLAPQMSWHHRNTVRTPKWRLKIVSRFRTIWQSIQRKSRPNRIRQ
jgi:hypothetical protein